MTKFLPAVILMLGMFSINCIGQNAIKINAVKSVPSVKSKTIPPLPKGAPFINLNEERCASGKIHQTLMATDPVYKANYEREQKNIQQTIAGWKSGAKAMPPVYTVPLVFHVIHKGEAVGSGTNISDAQIQSAVDALNRDYRRTSVDGGIAQGNGPDTEIQFCLATKDPNGNTTTGIVRVNGTTVANYSSEGITCTSCSSGASESAVKALSKWDNTKYLNIWVVSEIGNNKADTSNLNNFGGGVLGYAYLPPASSNLDGVVALHCCVGNDPNQNQGYRLWWATLTNRTLTHEIGHSLGLSHTFDDSNQNSCLDGDGLADTPPAKYATQLFTCTNPQSQGACTNQNIAIYMDYTPEECQNMFSTDETNVMRAVLAGSRNSLTTSSNTNCTSCTAATVTISSTNPSCTSNNGSATVNATGGTTPYTYLWSNGGTTQTISALGAGTYMVTVTATGGCTSTQSVTLTVPGAPTVTTSKVNESAAGACDGTATASATGGTTPYTYLWSNGQNTATATGLCSGTYTITVTGQNSCSATSTVIISSPTPAGCDTLFNYDIATDSAALYGSSGWGYVSGHNNYDDRAKADFFTATAGDTVKSVILTFAKAYGGSMNSNVVVKIWNGTGGTPGNVIDSVTVPISQLSTVQPVIIPFANPVVSGNFFCGIQFSANGIPQDTVALYTNIDGQTTPSTAWEMWNDGSWHNFGDTTSSWGLDVAHAIWVITCPGNSSPNCTGFTAAATSTNPTCGNSNGTATASGTGGTTPYTYQWSNNATTATISELASGTYTVTVTTANLCTTTANVTLANSGTAPTATATSVNATNGCNGSASVSASGGNTPYTYLWSNGQTTASISGLCAGTYTITVTGSNGCITTTSTMIISSSNCDSLFYFDGIYYTVQPGDTAGFQFNSIDNDQKTPDSSLIAYGINSNWQIYSEVITPGDTNRFIGATSYFNPPGQADNWLMFGGTTIPSTGATLSWDYKIGSNFYRDGYRVLINTTGSNISDFSAATVLKTVADNDTSTNGDTVWTNNSVQITSPFVGQKVYIAFHHNANDQFLIFFDNITIKDCNISPNCSGFTASATSTNPSCGNNNGTATAATTGGTTPYTYLWSNNATTASISGLVAGTYSVTVTGGNSCTATGAVTLTSSSTPTVTATSTNPSCGNSNGTATAAATGGTVPYTYSWSNGQTTANISGLAAGTYSVTVTDGNQCTAASSATITNSGTSVTLTTSSSNASCGTNNGSATVTASGGTTPYSYMWSNGQTTDSISGLGAGTYSVTVTGGNCTATASAVVTGGGNMNAAVSLQNANCNDICNGQASVAPSGGTTPYSFLWSNSATTASINALCAGSYSVTITDGTGCTVAKQVTISTNSPAMFVSSGAANATCNNANGNATINASGGTTPYSYFWNSNPPQTTQTATGLSLGNYIGIVTDSLGCNDTVAVSINNIGGVMAAVTNNPTICAGTSTTLVASGGSTYLWDTGQSTSSISISPTTTTTYYVTVSDNFQCSDSASTTVTVNAIPVTTVAASDDTVCKGESVMLVASGGTSYIWNNTADTNDTIYVTPAQTTTYFVTGMNGNCFGNTVSIKINVVQPSPVANASSDVSITYISQGGTVNFSSANSVGTLFGWDFDGDGTVDALTANATHSYMAAGIYSVILSVTLNNCTDYDTLQITVYNQVGINEPDAESGITVFPNPNDGKFQLKISGLKFQIENSTVKIYNILGNEVYSSEIRNPKSKIQNLNLPSGIYYVNISDGDKVFVKKVIVL